MKKRIAVMAVALVLLIAGTVWAFMYRSDRQIDRAYQMQKEAFVPGKWPSPEKFESIQKEMDRLSTSQREEVGRRIGRDMQQHGEEMIDRYFELPKEKQNEYLDKLIKEFDENMRRMASAGPPKGQPPPGAGPPGGAGGPKGPPPKFTTEKFQQWRNKFLDHTTPDRRAKGAAFFAAIIKRRQELGLPMFPPFPGPPRR